MTVVGGFSRKYLALMVIAQHPFMVLVDQLLDC
jgi:hypothetical protein